MGLDMYLTSRHRVKNYDFMKPTDYPEKAI